MKTAKLGGERVRVVLFTQAGRLIKNIPVSEWDGSGIAVQYDDREKGQIYYVDGVAFLDAQEAKQYALT